MRSCMNRNRLIVAAVFLFATTTSIKSQQGWVATRIAPADQDLNAVYFLDDKRGWVGGDNGFLIRTEDGGQNWLRQTVQTTAAINDIYFRDKEAGFLIAGNAIFATRDNGVRWIEVRRFLPSEFDGADIELYSVRFSSKKKGWVVGSVSKRERVIDSILLYTDDAGETWQRQRAPSRLELIHIDFRNDKRGLAVGERGTILRTTDSGATWTPVVVSARSTLLNVQYVNEDRCWAVGRSGTILRSDDGGLTWIEQASGTKQNLYSLYLVKKIGWAVGGGGMVLRYEL